MVERLVAKAKHGACASAACVLLHATGTSKSELGGMPLENERNVAIVMSQSARLIEFRGMPRLETVLEVEMNKNPGSW